MQALVQADHHVTAVVRPTSRGKSLAAACDVALFELNDVAAWERLVPTVDLVVYAAGSVRGRVDSDFTLANVDGVVSVASAIARSGSSTRMLLLSSLAATRPYLSHYASSKANGENALAAFEQVDWTAVRPPAVYGPGDKEMRPLLASIRAGLAVIPGPREQRLSLLYVSDLVTAMMSLLASDERLRHQVFELDDGRPDGYGWADLVEAVAPDRFVLRIPIARSFLECVARVNEGLAALLNYQPMLTRGKVAELSETAWLCNNRPLREATGWVPEVRLDRGAVLTFSKSSVN